MATSEALELTAALDTLGQTFLRPVPWERKLSASVQPYAEFSACAYTTSQSSASIHVEVPGIWPGDTFKIKRLAEAQLSSENT